MFSFNNNQIIALDFSGEKIISLVIESARNSQNQQQLINLVSIKTYASSEELLAELPKLKYSKLVVIPQNADVFSFITNRLEPNTWHNEVTRKSINLETHTANYLQLPAASLLCAVSNTTIEQLSSFRNAVIVPESLAQLYCYYRFYSDYHRDSVAILSITSEHAQITTFKNESAIYINSVEFEGSDFDSKYSQLIELLTLTQTEIAKLGIANLNHLLISTQIDELNIHELRAFSDSVEFLDVFRTNTYNVDRLSTEEKLYDGQKLSTLLAAASLTFENISMDFIASEVDNLNLINELSTETNFHSSQSITNKLSNYANELLAKATPMISRQRTLFFVGLAICLVVTLVRIYLSNTELVELEYQITEQEKIRSSFEGINNTYNEYQQRLNSVQNRVNSITEIRTNQLTVYTTLNNLESRLPKLVNFSTLNVTGNTVEGSGWSIDDFAVRSLMSELNSSTVFADVTPKYNNPEPKKTTFDFRTTYSGSVPVLSLPAVVGKLESTQMQQQQQQNNSNQTNQNNQSSQNNQTNQSKPQTIDNK
ncbi:MAG: hypothetical protein WAQ98_16185 [Blastocatellia bacterium]